MNIIINNIKLILKTRKRNGKFFFVFFFFHFFPRSVTDRYLLKNRRSSSSSSSSSSTSFIDDYEKNHIKLTIFQRTILSAGAAALSLADPFRGDMIACLGETTGNNALKHCYEVMKSSDEGKRIIYEKPRINSKTLDVSSLKYLPDNTLGKCYYNFLNDNNVTPDSRSSVKFIDDIELAYVMQRYREVHDIYHAALSMPTHMLGEVTVKWVEAMQTNLPMCISGGIFGAMRLRPRQRKLYTDHYLPWALRTGREAKFLLSVYFEERWDQPIDEFHKEMNIIPIDIQAGIIKK